MKSVWSEETDIKNFEKLDSDITTDVLVIGGGMAGILCAYKLQVNGIDYVLCEAENVCGGITKNTTAKITSQHGLIYNKIATKYNLEHAEMYLRANESAIGEYRKLCEKIDCHFEEKNSFVYSLDGKSKLEKEFATLSDIGFSAIFSDTVPLPLPVSGAVEFHNQAQFNPLEFISAISKGLRIYEHTKIDELIGTTAIAGKHKIKAKAIIVATHFPFINKHGSYFIKMYQHRSYVIALENAESVNGMYVDEAEKGMSFRNYEKLLLLGGGDHRTGKKGGNWNELTNFATEHYPSATEKYRWATQDCMTLDGIPYIGNYSANTPNLYVATGFNKWGMTTSMVAADILVDAIMGKSNDYAPVFSPSRSIIHPKLISNSFEAVTNLLSFSKKRCPHLGCALKWNSQEHSWDCPCHGSRFTEDGHIVDNPATGNLE